MHTTENCKRQTMSTNWQQVSIGKSVNDIESM